MCEDSWFDDEEIEAIRVLRLRAMSPGMNEVEMQEFYDLVKSRPRWFIMEDPIEVGVGGKKIWDFEYTVEFIDLLKDMG